MLVYRKLESMQDSLSESTNNAIRVQELLDRAKEDHVSELSTLNSEREKQTAKHNSELAELVRDLWQYSNLYV